MGGWVVCKNGHPERNGREKACLEPLLVDDLALLIHRPPMGDVAGFRGDGHTTFGHGASVGFVGNGIALGVYLRQSATSQGVSSASRSNHACRRLYETHG